MTFDKEGLASRVDALLVQRVGETFDGECHLTAAEAKELIDAIATLMAAIATPEAVHANMLRGGIPTLSIRQALHLHGAEALQPWDRAQSAEASLASAREDALEEAAKVAGTYISWGVTWEYNQNALPQVVARSIALKIRAPLKDTTHGR